MAATAADELRGLEVDYVEVAAFDGHPTLVIAARVGKTRLIDNVPLDEPALAETTAPDVIAKTAADAKTLARELQALIG